MVRPSSKFAITKNTRGEIDVRDFVKVTNADQIKKLKSLIKRNDMDLQAGAIVATLQSKGIDIDINVIEQACAALNAGLNIIFSGPPGTGKTTLAEAITSEANKRGYSKEKGIFTTATADWTTFDTVGGYLPSPSTGSSSYSLKFFEGQFLEAMKKNTWLVIDELNRADIDKAIGPLFTVLSKKNVELPYFINEKRVKIRFSEYPVKEESVYTQLPNWRIIATMNSYDKMSLYRISSAFLRRFAVIYVGLPINYRNYIKKIATLLDEDVQEALLNVILSMVKFREIGPSIVNDMVKYIGKRSNQKEGFCEAINMFLLPQLETVEEEILVKLFDLIGTYAKFVEVDNSNSIKAQRLIFNILEIESGSTTPQGQEPTIENAENHSNEAIEEGGTTPPETNGSPAIQEE